MIFSDFLSTPIQNRNILLALRIRNCGIGWDDMSFLGTKVQLRLVESVMDNQSPIISQSGSQVLVGLRNLSSLYLTFDHDQISTKLCIHDLLPTSDPLAMRNLSILSLHCYLPNQHVVNKTHCAARQIWFDSELLRQSFPKLQTLGFKRVYPKGDTPIGFPWFPKKLPYPFGLYRSYYYRHLSYNISQDFNMTRRIFNVERIWKLHPSMFCPMEYVVHDIVIRNCGISFIPEDCFWRIEGLRFLDISFNPITKISSATFVNQTTLSKLYIRKTWIRSFPNGTFDDLRSLNLLVISNNKLQFLQSGLFLI